MISDERKAELDMLAGQAADALVSLGCCALDPVEEAPYLKAKVDELMPAKCGAMSPPPSEEPLPEQPPV